MLLKIRQLQVQLGGRQLLSALDLTANKGEVVGLIGANGAGKTTLIKAIAQLLPYQGAILIQDQPITQFHGAHLARQLSYLAQGHQAFWDLPVQQLIALGRLPHLSAWQRLTNHDWEKITAVMAQVGIHHLATRRFMTLSGGEQALVMLARALVVEATILLADEPVTALDPFHQLQVMELLQTYAQQGRSVIVVLHDLTLASRFCQHLVLLQAGKVLAQGQVTTVLSAANLRESYHVNCVQGEYQGQAYFLPWQRVATDK